MTHSDMKKMCEDHLNKYVLVKTKDDQQFEGIVEHVDKESVYLAVVVTQITGYGAPPQGPSGFGYGFEGSKEDDERVFAPGVAGVPAYGGFGGYPAYGYGGYAPYGRYPYYRPSPFRRLILPLAALTAISVLPFYY